MRHRKFSAKLVLLSCLLPITVSISATTRQQNAPRRICVVTVHDSSLFTFCPPVFRKSLADGLQKKLPPPGDKWYTDNWNRGFRFGNYEMLIAWDGRLGFRQQPGHWSYWLPPALLLPDPGILERNRPDWQELSKLTPGICPSGWMDPAMAREIGDEIRKNKDYILVNDVEESDFVFLVESLYSFYQSPVDGTWLSYGLYDENAGSPRQFCIFAIAVVVPMEIYQGNPVDA